MAFSTQSQAFCARWEKRTTMYRSLTLYHFDREGELIYGENQVSYDESIEGMDSSEE